MVKILGYHLFALVYNLCRLFPIKDKQILCITTHDDGEGSNVNLAAKAIKEKAEGYSFSYITKADTNQVKGSKGIGKRLSFFFRKPYQMSRSCIILMDNIFLPLSCMKIRKETTVVQLWHGTGSIKKFGQDVNTGKLKKLEWKANRNITHLIVNSEKTREIYAKAFGIEERCVYPIGLPKTDEIIKGMEEIKKTGINSDKDAIYRRYSIPENHKLILYAPTFRDDGQDRLRTAQLLLSIQKGLPEDYHLGLRLHPFVAEAYGDASLPERVYQLSFEPDLTSVLMASDVLITDYSSIVFEYCLIERPMLFYAYDLEEFSDSGRGFYEDYESFVPGPVVKGGAEAAKIIRENNFDIDKIKEFNARNFSCADGKAGGRLLDLIL